MKIRNIMAVAVGLLFWGASAQATLFVGNSANGFGGAVGEGSLELTDDGTTISGTFTRGGGDVNDALVLYIDTVAGGFSTTENFTDSADGLRRAISGYNGTDRSTLTFDTGFEPDFAIALAPAGGINFGGLWGLVANGSHDFIESVNLDPVDNNSAATYTFSFLLSDIGINPGDSFNLFATYIAESAWRSNEAIAGGITDTAGHEPFTQDGWGTYTTIPEPGTMGMLGLALAGLAYYRRRRV